MIKPSQNPLSKLYTISTVYVYAAIACFSALKTKVQGLHTAGCTALGPALAVSVAMASDRPTSSEIILCTDGVPNTGVGSLSGRRDTTGFYNTVSYLYNGVASSLVMIHTDRGICSKL